MVLISCKGGHVLANGLKTARVVKLIFHTVLLGGKNTHKHTHWNMEDGGRGGFGGGLVMFMLCAFVLGSDWVGGLNTLHVQCIIVHTKIKPGLPD